MDECIMEILSLFARTESAKYRDLNCKDPIDEDDVAFMYLVGYMAGKGKEFSETKRLALGVAHHFMRRGIEIAERHKNVLPQDEFRISLE